MEEETYKSNSKTPTLPDELIEDQILPRLEVKPLTRFKSVSKSRLCTISTPQFAKSQLKLFPSSPSSQFLNFQCNYSPLFTSVTFDEHGRVDEILKFEYKFNYRAIRVVGCRNGLVCFANTSSNLYICNPITQQCNRITNEPDESDPTRFLSDYFGYISSENDYKIVCFMGVLSSGDMFDYSNDLVDCVYIFSSRTCNWEKNSISAGIARLDNPILIWETLYWFTGDKNIAGLNLINKKMAKISLLSLANVPDLYQPYKIVKLFATKEGLLSLCCGSEVWMMKSHGLSWVKLYELNLDDNHLMCISETGKWFVVKDRVLGLLDPRNSFNGQYKGGNNSSIGVPIFQACDFKMRLISLYVL